MSKHSAKSRIPFRTTIDADLLRYLKQYALDKGVDANDVIESMIRKQLLSRSESAYMSGAYEDMFGPMTNDRKKEHIRFRIAEAIEDTLMRLGYKPRALKDQDFFFALGAAVADLVVEEKLIG